MADFDINGVSYQSRLMDGETQTLVLKRLLPTFTAMVGVAEQLSGLSAPVVVADDEEEANVASAQRERMVNALAPVSEKLAALSDADTKFILDACLNVTSRQAGTGSGQRWVPVVQRGIVQDQNDTKFVTRLTIAYHVLSENFGDMLTSLGVDFLALKGMAPIALG